jgi:hypothetical protein
LGHGGLLAARGERRALTLVGELTCCMHRRHIRASSIVR